MSGTEPQRRFTAGHPALQKPVGTRTDQECWEIALENKGLLFSRFGKFNRLASAAPSVTLQSDDVAQEGMIALYQAAKKYDPSLGFTFSTFAVSQLRLRLMDVGLNDRKPTGGSRTKNKKKWNQRVADVNSLEEMADHRFEGDDNHAALPSMRGKDFRDDFWVDNKGLAKVIASVRATLSPEDQLILDAKMNGREHQRIGVELGFSRGYATYRWRYKIEPKVRKALRGLEDYLKESG